MPSSKTGKNPSIKLKTFLPIIVIIAFIDTGLLSAAENPVGTIIGISGTIEYQSGSPESVADAGPGGVQKVSFNKWEKAEFRQAVYARDTFRTARKSRLKILLADKSLIALGPNSKMKVESYLYNKNEKLRQGVIGLVHGFSSYIVNKSQTNKNSSFRMVTPTANLSARGTTGFVAFSKNNTSTANKAGKLKTSNVRRDIPGSVELRDMMGNNVPVDGPPAPAKPVSPATMNNIEKIVMGLNRNTSGGGNRGGGNPLVEVQENKEDGGEGEENTEFFDRFFDPVNNPFPDQPGAENTMMTCKN